jgi:uncharacterized protein YdhG (YjbR/CyaY superfamily)
VTQVETYILQFEPLIQERLNAIRQLFFELLPDTEEFIRYNMPAFKVGKHFLYFAAYKKHIGFYPIYNLPLLEESLAAYKAKNTKDTLHFVHHEPLPLNLIKQIIIQKAQAH